MRGRKPTHRPNFPPEFLAEAQALLRQRKVSPSVMRSRGWMAAFCYIAPEMEPRPPTDEYIELIVGSAREHGFPAWYIARLESFRKGTRRHGKGGAVTSCRQLTYNYFGENG
jgi:hypothetical protein